MSGHDLPAGSPPPPPSTSDPGDYLPFHDWLDFKLTDFLYCQNQMSGAGINVLLDIWAVHSLKLSGELSFLKHKDIYKTIDSIPLVNIPWESFSLYYQGKHPEDEHPPAWMDAEYDVWFWDPQRLLHDLIVNSSFQEEFDYFPYHVLEQHSTVNL